MFGNVSCTPDCPIIYKQIPKMTSRIPHDFVIPLSLIYASVPILTNSIVQIKLQQLLREAIYFPITLFKVTRILNISSTRSCSRMPCFRKQIEKSYHSIPSWWILVLITIFHKIREHQNQASTLPLTSFGTISEISMKKHSAYRLSLANKMFKHMKMVTGGP